MSQLLIYETSNMEAAHLHNNPGEDSGYPAENCLDNNLDTYWKASSGVSKDIQFDLGESKKVDCLLIFLKNYKTVAGGIDPYWSNDGSSWTSMTGFNLTDTTTPIRICTTGFGSTHRYWRAVFTMAQLYEIAGIWWGQLYTISQGHEYPELTARQFHNLTTNLSGGRLGIHPINKNPQRILERQFFISNTTTMNNLRNAIIAAQGLYHPVIINEGSSQGDAIVCRVDMSEFDDAAINYQLYEPRVRFAEIPYIDDGDTY